jgi:hypothetical protein
MRTSEYSTPLSPVETPVNKSFDNPAPARSGRGLRRQGVRR